MTPTTHHFQASDLPYWTRGNLLPVLEIEEDCVSVRIDDTRVQIWNSTHGERPIADIWKVQMQRWLRENERKALTDVHGNYDEIISVMRAMMQKSKTRKVTLDLTIDECADLVYAVRDRFGVLELAHRFQGFDLRVIRSLFDKVKEATK